MTQRIIKTAHNLKPFLNKLSPGCIACRDGAWSCIYINRLCTRNCFFCPQDRRMRKESAPQSEMGFKFNTPDEYTSYLKKFEYDGIGFSGGEPFLVFDRLIAFIKKVRQYFGNKYYIWVYTNGDLVTKEKLKILKKVGLNELRFDLSANGYNLNPVRLATKYIKNVTIEIPAIPEDIELVKKNLKNFERIGVKYLNIHQLNLNKFNKKALLKRGYIALNNPHSLSERPIVDSELTAFEILKHAKKIKLKMGVNYCSLLYKNIFQGQAHRKRIAKFCLTGNVRITKTGYICEISKLHSQKIKVRYYTPVLLVKKSKDVKSTSTLDNTPLFVKKLKSGQINLENETSIFFFERLFIENQDPKSIAKKTIKAYGLDTDAENEVLKDIQLFKEQFAFLEYIPNYIQN